jgi:hypothetical protein
MLARLLRLVHIPIHLNSLIKPILFIRGVVTRVHKVQASHLVLYSILIVLSSVNYVGVFVLLYPGCSENLVGRMPHLCQIVPEKNTVAMLCQKKQGRMYVSLQTYRTVVDIQLVVSELPQVFPLQSWKLLSMQITK